MILTWSQGVADDWMSEDILVDLSNRVWAHPWWHARANLMLALLRQWGVHPSARVLDAGCGWGVNLEALERHGYRAVGLDISRRILERLDGPQRTLVEADLTQALPPETEPYDAVIALDVIEHLDDDRAAVARLGQLTKPGGLAILSVPALPDLFSEFDEVQGHRRRYLPETLRQAFLDSDLGIEHMLWWGSWMVPLLRRRRAKARATKGLSSAEIYQRYLTLPPWPLSSALRLAFAFDHMWTLSAKSHLGTTLFAVARRADGVAADPSRGRDRLIKS